MRLLNAKFFLIPVIFFIGCAVYSNSFLCSFHLDDISSIVQNPFIRNLYDFKTIWHFLPRRFILYLSLALNYHFDQFNVFGYHLFNLCVHLITAMLVAWLMKLTLATPVMRDEKISSEVDILALCAGLIFVSHPIQTEAVTYIVQRAASMAVMFYLLSLCCYIQSRLLMERQGEHSFTKNGFYIGSLLMTILGMFTKEIVITLPLIILLYEFSFFRTQKKLILKYITPFLMTIFIIPLTILFTESDAHRVKQLHNEAGISSVHYLLTQLRVLVTYIRLMMLPIHQNLDYDYPVLKNILNVPVMLSFLLITGILAYTKQIFFKLRLLAFAILWFFLTLLPESSLLPIKDVIFEHRLYLPMVGYSIFVVVGAYYIIGKNNIKVMLAVLLVLISCYGVLTYQRNKIWYNEITLWNDTIQKSPHKARPYNNRGLAFMAQDNLEKAFSDYDMSIEIDPTSAETYNNRGYAYIKAGNLRLAIKDLDRAVVLNPEFAEAYNNRGQVYFRRGNYKDAFSDYSKAILLNPNYSLAYYNRGVLDDVIGDHSQSLLDYRRTQDIEPNNANVFFKLAYDLTKQGDVYRAIDAYSKAIEINPTFIEAYINRGILYENQGFLDQAILNYRRLLRKNLQMM